MKKKVNKNHKTIETFINSSERNPSNLFLNLLNAFLVDPVPSVRLRVESGAAK